MTKLPVVSGRQCVRALEKAGFKDTEMRRLCIDYPESLPAILNVSPEVFEQEARMALAMKLFEMGKMSSGQAALLAGVSRAEFLLSCRQYGAASVQWDDTELEAEFRETGE